MTISKTLGTAATDAIIAGVLCLDADAQAETKRFFHDTFSGTPSGVRVPFAVATGKPDVEVLRLADAADADLIVISSRGATGIRRLFLGSTTELSSAANVDSERRDRADRRLQAMTDVLPTPPRTEPLVVFGEPAEEIAKIAIDRQAQLIVMGLHASAVSGARMGSVTYRVLSATHGLVLALPPDLATVSGTSVA